MHPNNSLSLLPVATVFFLTSLLPGNALAAADLAREQRLAEQTVDAILDGDPVDLVAGDHTFLGIFMDAETTPAKGAALILHGRGTHPDWSQVANPLRTALPADGWATLSLQMPVLAKDAKFYDYVAVFPDAIPRIDAGINYLRAHGFERIVLVSHSCGVHMSMAWLGARGDTDIAAYIGIGMGATDYKQPMRSPFPFDRLTVPFLNIHGSNDYPAVQRMSNEIETFICDMHPASRQVTVQGADHYFDDHNEELSSAIINWLATLTAPPDSR